MAAPNRDSGSGNKPRRLDRRSQYLAVEGKNEAQVTDFDFGAYLLMRRVPFVKAVRISDRECLFTFSHEFEIDGKRYNIQDMSIEFANSESARFGDAMRRLKKTIYSVQGRRNRGRR